MGYAHGFLFVFASVGAADPVMHARSPNRCLSARLTVSEVNSVMIHRYKKSEMRMAEMLRLHPEAGKAQAQHEDWGRQYLHHLVHFSYREKKQYSANL
jgi:hypothetical protein